MEHPLLPYHLPNGKIDTKPLPRVGDRVIWNGRPAVVAKNYMSVDDNGLCIVIKYADDDSWQYAYWHNLEYDPLFEEN